MARTRSQGYVSAYEVEAVYSPILAQYLVVAGGGGGGRDSAAGGGGAGGVRCTKDATGGGGALETPFLVTLGTTYTVTIGAGGNGSRSIPVSGTATPAQPGRRR